MACLLLHEYLASGAGASLHKANFILYFVNPFKSLKENHHGLIAMKFEIREHRGVDSHVHLKEVATKF